MGLPETNADANPRHNYTDRQLRKAIHEQDAIRCALLVARDYQYRAHKFLGIHDELKGQRRDEDPVVAAEMARRTESAMEAAHRAYGAADALEAYAEMLRQGRHHGCAERGRDAEFSEAKQIAYAKRK